MIFMSIRLPRWQIILLNCTWHTITRMTLGYPVTRQGRMPMNQICSFSLLLFSPFILTECEAQTGLHLTGSTNKHTSCMSPEAQTQQPYFTRSRYKDTNWGTPHEARTQQLHLTRSTNRHKLHLTHTTTAPHITHRHNHCTSFKTQKDTSSTSHEVQTQQAHPTESTGITTGFDTKHCPYR